MTIELHPKALEQIITSPYAEKRLRNREGFATAQDSDGQTVWGTEGPILEVHAQAVAFESNNPELAVTVVEHSCGSLVNYQANFQQEINRGNL